MFAWCRSNRERAVLSYKEAIEFAKQSHRERSIRLPHRRWRGPRARVIDPVAGACAPERLGTLYWGSTLTCGFCWLRLLRAYHLVRPGDGRADRTRIRLVTVPEALAPAARGKFLIGGSS